RGTGSPQYSTLPGAVGKKEDAAGSGGGWTAKGCACPTGMSGRLITVRSNPRRFAFLAFGRPGSGGGPEIPFDREPMARHLRLGQALEPPSVPVLGRVARIAEQVLVGQGVDGPPGQDLQHLGAQLRPRQRPEDGEVNAAHV